MSLSVIPLTILGQITGVTGSGDTVLYQVSFKSIDGTTLYGVTAVWTDEQAEIEALAAQKPYGVWINPIDGTFTVKFAGYTYVGSADLTDPDVLAGITPIEFVNQSGGGSGLPAVTTDDNGKILQVENGEWTAKDASFIDIYATTQAFLAAAQEQGVLDRVFTAYLNKDMTEQYSTAGDIPLNKLFLVHLINDGVEVAVVASVYNVGSPWFITSLDNTNMVLVNANVVRSFG